MTTARELLESVRPISSAWRPFSAGFERTALPAVIREVLPPEYLSLIALLGGGEGFIATRFFRLYPLGELDAVNRAYQVQTYLPRHVLFGSDGIGQAFLFERGEATLRIVEMPFIPLDPEYVTTTQDDFMAFLRALTQIPTDFRGSLPIEPDPATAGLELHEKHPIVLGGDPTRLENKVFLPPPIHAQACCYFNRLFRDVRAQSVGG